jgi:hypothetical protein
MIWEYYSSLWGHRSWQKMKSLQPESNVQLVKNLISRPYIFNGKLFVSSYAIPRKKMEFHFLMYFLEWGWPIEVINDSIDSLWPKKPNHGRIFFIGPFLEGSPGVVQWSTYNLINSDPLINLYPRSDRWKFACQSPPKTASFIFFYFFEQKTFNFNDGRPDFGFSWAQTFFS